jgi:hypothetical protein
MAMTSRASRFQPDSHSRTGSVCAEPAEPARHVVPAADHQGAHATDVPVARRLRVVPSRQRTFWCITTAAAHELICGPVMGSTNGGDGGSDRSPAA